MTTYTKATNFATKDALLTGNPSKVVKGTEIDAEFTAIQAADATSLKSGGALGTPSSGTVTNLTGTASININGTVGATTRTTGSFTTAWADTQLKFGSTGVLVMDPGNPASGPGGNAYDGGILAQGVSGAYQVSAYQIAPTTHASKPEWGPITELVLRRTTDQSTDLQRISLTAMADWANPGLSDAATDYRLQQEASGTQDVLDMKVVSQKNSTGWLVEFIDFEADGTVTFFRRTDSPANTGDSLEVAIGQLKRGAADVLTSNGTQDSPSLRLFGASYDGSLHTVNWRQYVDVTSNAGASTYKVQTAIDGAAWSDALTITSGGTIATAASAITTSQTTIALINTTATTINFAGAATTLNIGNSGGTNTVLGATAFSQGITVEAKTAFTFAGTWADLGAGQPACKYWKDPLGYVHLEGSCTGGGADTITTLPSGYRPAAVYLFDTNAGGALARVQIDTLGVVTSTSHTSLNLNKIYFRP